VWEVFVPNFFWSERLLAAGEGSGQGPRLAVFAVQEGCDVEGMVASPAMISEKFAPVNEGNHG